MVDTTDSFGFLIPQGELRDHREWIRWAENEQRAEWFAEKQEQVMEIVRWPVRAGSAFLNSGLDSAQRGMTSLGKSAGSMTACTAPRRMPPPDDRALTRRPSSGSGQLTVPASPNGNAALLSLAVRRAAQARRSGVEVCASVGVTAPPAHRPVCR